MPAASKAARTGAQVPGGRGHGEALLVGLDVLGPGLQGDLHDPVLVDAVAEHDQQAAPAEQVGDAAGVGQAAAALGDHVADVGGGAVAVVGQGLDHHRHPAGGVRLEGWPAPGAGRRARRRPA
jgi:hypothetical protein